MTFITRIAAVSMCFLMLSRAAGEPTPGAVRWHTPGVASSRALPLAQYTPDELIKADASDGSLKLSLASSEGQRFSYVELKDHPDYTPCGVARIQIAQISGGVWTLQAVAYDANGKASNYVDLIDNVDSAGTYEVPMKIYRTPLKDAKTIGLRIWIAGGDPHATIRGVWWGIIK
jgi:hypothetical protein